MDDIFADNKEYDVDIYFHVGIYFVLGQLGFFKEGEWNKFSDCPPLRKFSWGYGNLNLFREIMA